MKIKLLFIVVYILNTLLLNAQAPNWAWEKNKGSNQGFPVTTAYNNETYGNGIITDSNGNVYTVGAFQSYTLAVGNYTLTNTSNTGTVTNVFIAKYDATGNVLWAKSVAGTSGGTYVEYENISIDASGNIYITGGFSSQTISFDAITLTKTTNQGAEDIFIAKYTSSGSVAWAKNFGGSKDDYGNAIAVDALNNIYMSANFSSDSITIGSYTLRNDNGSEPNGFNMCIAKLDANGNIVFAKRVGLNCTINTCGNNMITDANNNLYVTGMFTNCLTIIGNDTSHCSSNSGSYFLVKYDASGNPLWARYGVGCSQTSEANDITLDAYGSVYIAGNFKGTCFVIASDTLSHSAIDNSGFLAKYSSSGTALWAKNMNTATGTNALDASLNHLATDAYGNIYVAGGFANGYNGSTYPVFGSDTLKNNVGGQAAIYVAKYDTAGNSIWGQTAQSNAWSEIGQVTTDKYGNIFVTGLYSCKDFIFNNTDTLYNANEATTSNPAPDYFIAKIGTVGVGIKKYNSIDNVIVYPNPSNGGINIANTNNIDEIKVTDMLGQIVYEAKPNTENTILKIDNSGIYFITITSGTVTSTKKVIIDK